MPLLEGTQTRDLSASIRLTDTTASQVNQYAAFIHASADDVVEQAPMSSPKAATSRSFFGLLKRKELRRRFVCVEAPQVRWRNRPLRGRFPLHHRLPNTCSRSGIESMISHLDRWYFENGASHRMYFDTPPLTGSCRYTNVNLHKWKEIH
jgi:hypothetical protein